LHRNEHSIEFQVLFLAHALGLDGYEIAPILISSFHEMVARDVPPVSEPRVGGFIDALAGEIAAERRRVLIIAGVDFAHIGKKFGDEFAVDEAAARRLKRDDLEMVEYIKNGDAAGFFSSIARDHDRRRICGLAPIYTQLQLLGGREARLLMYDIAIEPQSGSAVSFASLTIA
ncbi:MAG: AmmeMemoRadiSam system protein B, partial [Candidatus Binataceae bacterium]